MNTCTNCGQEVEGKSKWCSDRCRKAYARKSDKNPDIPNPDTSARTGLTSTDQTFYDRQVRDSLGDYYYFSSKRYERGCQQCSKAFVTSLKSLHFCSYNCLQEATKVSL